MNKQLEERMKRSAEAVKAIRELWEAKAAAGDLRAARLLRECFELEPPRIVNQPTPDKSWVATVAEKMEREPGEEG